MTLTFEQVTKIADDAAAAKANAVLRAMAIFQAQLASHLIAKGILAKGDYAAAITKMQKDVVASRENAPDLFHAVTTVTMMLEQLFSEAPSGPPS